MAVWLLPTAEVHYLHLVIAKNLFTVNSTEKTKIKKKRPGMVTFLAMTEQKDETRKGT